MCSLRFRLLRCAEKELVMEHLVHTSWSVMNKFKLMLSNCVESLKSCQLHGVLG